jgi:integrase
VLVVGDHDSVVGRGWIEHQRTNPQGVAQVATKADPANRRLPYEADDLKKLFKMRRKDGADHWLPLLALWTGARLEELGQLHVSDVRQQEGVHYLAIQILAAPRACPSGTCPTRVLGVRRAPT